MSLNQVLKIRTITIKGDIGIAEAGLDYLLRFFLILYFYNCDLQLTENSPFLGYNSIP